MEKLQPVLFVCLLLIATISDLRSRIIPDWVSFLILLIGLLSFNASSITGAIIAALPFLIVAMITGKLGGGDVKLIGAIGFVLGPYRGTYASVIAFLFLFAFLILLKSLGRKGLKDQSFAFAPFLSAGGIIMYFL